MKITKKTGIIAIVLVAAIALMGFGFAAWTAQLTAEGTVKGSVEGLKWEVVWQDCTISDSSKHATATAPTGVKDSTSFTIPEITFGAPGAYVEYVLTAVNKGTIGADFVSLTATVSGSDDVSAEVVSEPLCNLQPNGTCTFTLVVSLSADITATDYTLDTTSIKVELNYEQEDMKSETDIPAAKHTK